MKILSVIYPQLSKVKISNFKLKNKLSTKSTTLTITNY